MISLRKENTEKTRTTYHVCVFAPQMIADSPWPDWKNWTAEYDLITDINHGQPGVVGGVISERRNMYVKEAKTQMSKYSVQSFKKRLLTS